MKCGKFLALAAAAVLAIVPASYAAAADAAHTPAGVQQAIGELTPDQLGQMLVNLGYEVERIEVQGTAVFKVKMDTKYDGNAQIMAIDPATNLVVIMGSGYSVPENLTAEGAKVLAKLMSNTVASAPSSVVVNDKSALVYTTAFANRGLTPSLLRRHIDHHVHQMNNVFAPLAYELYETSLAPTAVGGTSDGGQFPAGL